MTIKKETKKDTYAVRFAYRDGKKEVARAFLYIIRNELHREPYGFLEDVFVNGAYRGKGLGTKIVRAAIAEAKKIGCYKLICTSQSKQVKVHRFYEKLGLKKYGFEFRIDLL